MVPEHLSLHFFQFFYDLLCIFEVHCQTQRNMHSDPRTKIKNYNRVLRRPSPQSHLAGGVLLGRAYRGCDWEARRVEEFESFLPMLVFRAGVARIEVIGVDGGSGVRVAGGVEEGELGVVERQACEHCESMRKLLG